MRFPSLAKFLREHWAVFAIFLLAIAVRIYAVHGGSVMFWYDQARDFTIVKDIAVNRDIKIQGPSASGTNDTIYHGVLYYYILTPFYLLGGGSPQTVAYFLAVLGSFSIFIIYAIGLSVFKSKSVALLASTLLAVSFIHSHQATWLSNPQLLTLSAGIFYLSLWKIFFEKPQLFYFITAGISLGLSIQAGFFEIFLILTFVAIYIRRSFVSKKIVLFSIKEIVLFITSFLAVVSTMIITQFLMISRGVLTIEKLQAVKRDVTPASDVLNHIFDLYMKNLQDSLIPTGLVLLFLLFLVPLFLSWKNQELKAKEWLLFIVTAPLWLLTMQFRNSDHILIGVELMTYLLLASGLLWIKKHVFQGKLIFLVFIVVFVLTNISSLQYWKMNRIHYYGIQRGALLSEQLALIDKTYQLAEGNDFTISSSTNPYAINVTWGYLYDWYGKQKYGYVPSYYGMSQVGYYGSGLLPEVFVPAPTHFTIMEPDTGLASRIMAEFLADQDLKSSTPSAELKFGTLGLQVR